MFLVTTFNVADRNILNVLLEPIKDEFGVSDTAMGFLVGPAFAIVHIVASFAIATLADRSTRRSVVGLGLFLWSGLTALCGLVTQFWQLVIARFGVGAFEGAGSAPAHALLCDYFPIDRRARMMTIFGMGGMTGIALGYLLGALIAETHGWRATFFVLGIPGALLALVIRATVREPERGRLDGGAPPEPVPTLTVLARLRHTPSFVHNVLGASYHAFASMGSGAFFISYLIRSHDMSLGGAAISLMLSQQLFAAVGALGGAWLCDRLGKRDIRWVMWVPTIGALAAMPFSVAFVLWPAGGHFSVGSWALPTALLILIPGTLLGATWNGPALAMTQSVTPPNMRSRASALTTGTYNLIGMGLGPLCVGLISDAFEPSMGRESLRMGLLIIGVTHILGALHQWIASRSLKNDLASVGET